MKSKALNSMTCEHRRKRKSPDEEPVEGAKRVRKTTKTQHKSDTKTVNMMKYVVPIECFPHRNRVLTMAQNLKKRLLTASRETSVIFHLNNNSLDPLESIADIRNVTIYSNSSFIRECFDSTAIQKVAVTDLDFSFLKQQNDTRGHFAVFYAADEPENRKEDIRSMIRKVGNIESLVCGQIAEDTHRDLSKHFKSSRLHFTEENGKQVRAAITYYLEKEIKEYLLTLEQSALQSRNEIREAFLRSQRMTGNQKNGEHGLSKLLKVEDEYCTTEGDFNMKDAKEKLFEDALDEIRAIINEMIDEPGRIREQVTGNNTSTVPHSIQNSLKRYPEIIGFGFLRHEFEVWIDIDKTENLSASPALEQKLKVMHRRHGRYGDPKLRFLKKISYLQPGDKIYPYRKLPFGTIGAFAKTGESNIAALTCKHVLDRCPGRPFVETTKGMVEAGKKLISPKDARNDYDGLAITELDENLRAQCRLKIKKNGMELKHTLCTDTSESLTDQKVYKKGAATNWTEGKVISNDFKSSQNTRIAEAVIVRSSFCNNVFAEGGDSGSVVFRFSRNNPDDDSIDIISMIQGGYQDGDGHEFLTFRMNSAFEDFKKDTGVQLSLP